LSAVQDAIVLSLRQTLYLPLDDLLYITRQSINADVSLAHRRLLKREGMARLEDVIPKAEAEGVTITAKKTFKDYEPVSCTPTSSTCRRCPTRARAATCS
jgi:hypothetical protein